MTRRVRQARVGLSLLVAIAVLAWLAAGTSAPFSSLLRVDAAAAAQQLDVDTDGDTMPDDWEAFFGLNPEEPTDGAGNPDGDDLTNAEEYAARRHPVGRYVRYFAEGSTGYFDTTVSLLNPSQVETAHVVLALLLESGGVVSHQVTLGPRQRQSVSINDLLGAPAPVSIIVESDAPVSADRAMTWGPTGIGASLDSGVPAPATTWYFAEGATGPFLLYYLFENPAATPASVTIRYLIEGATPITTTRQLPPHSRTTVFVNNEDPSLVGASVGAVVTSDTPIVAERAMYVNAGGTFGGGSASAASHQLATDWYFAEGATGPFFHTFLALLNPGPDTVTATVIYHSSDGSTVSKSYEVPAEQRRTVDFIAEAENDPTLAALSTGTMWFTVSSTQPIVAERAMWWANWPWYEGHAALGSTASALAWVVPEGRHGGAALEQTYVLIANTMMTTGQVRVTLIPDSGAPVMREMAIGAAERLSLNIGELFELTDARFSIIVESLSTPATPLVVDYARYRSVNGIPFSGGGAAAAIPLSPSQLRGPNQPPAFAAGAHQTVLEDAGAQNIAGWATDITPGPADEADQAVTFTVTNNTNAALFSVAPAVSPAGTLTFTPAPDASGTATITLVLQDNGGTAGTGVDTSAPATFTITVDAVNDAPSFTAGTLEESSEDDGPRSVANWAASISPGPADESTQTLTFAITGNTNPALFSAGPAVSSTGTLTYTAAPDTSGSADITIVAHDNGGTAGGGVDMSAPHTLTITVDAVNDAPVVTTAGGPLVYAENAPATVIDPAIAVADLDSDTLGGATVQIVGNHQSGEDVLSFASTATITGTFTPATGLLTLVGTDTVANYELALRAVRYQNTSGTPTTSARTISWTITDGTTPSLAAPGTITVVSVNDAPSFTIGPNHASIEDAGPQSVPNWATAISPGPADESTQTLSFSVVINTNPALFLTGPTVSSDGTLTYQTTPDASGTADITIVLQDDGGTGNGGVDTSQPQTFRITVADDAQFTLDKTLTTSPANLDMPESYRLRISVPNTPGVLSLNVFNIVDTLPPGTVFNGATPAADCQPGCVGTTPATLTWTNACAVAVAPGASCDIAVNVAFPSGTFPSGTNVTNSFTADGTPAGEASRNLGNASTTHPVSAFVPAPGAGFSMNMASGTPNPPTLNEGFSYDMNVANSGNVPLDNLVVIATLPVEMRVLSVATGTYSGLAAFAAGEGVRVSYEKNTALGVFTLWGSSPNSTTNTVLTAPPPGLGAGEYVTRVRWEYGQAAAGMTPTARPLLTGEIINPDNAGGPVAFGDSIQACAALAAVFTAGPTNVSRNDCEMFTLASP